MNSKELSGVDHGDNAMIILDPMLKATEYGPTLQEAADALSRIDMTKDKWRETAAYLALQALNYRRVSKLDAELAMHQIETIVKGWKGRRNVNPS